VGVVVCFFPIDTCTVMVICRHTIWERKLLTKLRTSSLSTKRMYTRKKELTHVGQSSRA